MIRYAGRGLVGYALSYVALVCVALLIVGVVVYGTFIRSMEQEIAGTSVSMLKQVRDVTDSRMMDMNRIAQLIASDPDLVSDVPASEGYRMGEKVRSLAKFKAANSFAGEIAVYFRGKSGDRLFAASGMYELASFFQEAYRYANWSADSFLADFSELRQPVLRPLEPVTLNGVETRNRATYLYPLPLHASRPYGVILFQIDEREWSGMIRGVLNNEAGYSYIADDRGRLVAYAAERDREEESAALALRLPGDLPRDGVRTVSLDGEKLFVARIVSDYNGWSFVSILPAERALGPVIRSRNVFALCVLGVLAVSVLLSFVFGARQYRTERKLHTVIKSQARIVMEKELLDLIRGKTRDHDDKEPPFAPVLEFTFDRYIVAQLLIDRYKQAALVGSRSEPAVMLLSLKNVLEELAGDLGQGWTLEGMEPGGIILLLNVREDCTVEDVKELADKANAFLEQHFRFTCTAGIGCLYEEADLVYKSYLEANYAARSRYLRGGGQSFVYESLREHEHEQDPYRYRYELHPLLSAAIRKGDKDEASLRIGEIVASLSGQRLDVDMGERLSFDLVHTIMKTLSEAGIVLPDQAAAALTELFATRFETIAELEAAVIKFCQGVCDDIASRKESKNVELLEQALAFIGEFYTDGSLSAEGIADRLGVSRSYLSRYFKDQTGSPLMQYVDGLRMTKAKELLAETDLKIKEIVELVGLTDPNNFFRKFKKREGLTPQEYRDASNSSSGGGA
ncbi:helix-turn-helix domain-containing protein [Paenibacillus ginsengarvi]|uniref:AraC family transcriptional regulator n=1 Tax=Paenibacillus ginsengarvi TaxID=400777 RepID=A0A3B0APA4_9BACL|nr:helix-turn-helix domain-containing protein [Paenibacillus ginsengarvi]RKN62073.1 AraC family transcriptional regulator [Paenibacillus ginsengarvi]